METAVTNQTKNGQVAEEPRKVDVFSYGDRIIVPEDMTYEQARECLKRKEDEENTVVNISEKVRAFPMDGAYAFLRTLQRKYGWVNLQPTPSFFGPNPPSMVGVEVEFNKTIQVPWGRFNLPKIDGYLETSWSQDDGMPVFLLAGQVKRKHEKEIAGIAAEVRELVRRESIYRFKAIRINFRDKDGERKPFQANFCPRFIDLETTTKQEPMYPALVEAAIQNNVLTPIIHSTRCQQEGTPLKRGILLGGPYGTGKTLLGYKIARMCIRHGWTFCYLEDVRDLDMALSFARMYEPCVLFGEDLDRVACGPRTAEMDRMLNTLDGLESKDRQILTICTTNHLEAIHRAFLRPGRIDRTIKVMPPDSDTVVRLIRNYGQNTLGNATVVGSDDEIKAATKTLVGANASFVRAVVEEAKLAAITRNPEQTTLTITPADLKVVADSMLEQIRLVNPEHGKGLFDDDARQVDPLEMAGHILMDKFAFALLEKITNPKTISKVVVKKMGGMGPGGDPVLN